MDAPVILGLNFYLKVDKILKYIFFLDIYINMVIFRIIVNKVTEAGGIINANRDNIGNVHID